VAGKQTRKRTADPIKEEDTGAAGVKMIRQHDCAKERKTHRERERWYELAAVERAVCSAWVKP
jgi:hypothetical protein